MSADNPQKITQKTVVLVSNNKKHAERDKHCLLNMKQRRINHFASGTEAFQFLTTEGCDIILCDTDIEDMSAQALIKTIKNNPSLRHVPVVMVTVQNDRAAVLTAISVGCSGYIIRPYSENTFEKHFKTALQLERLSEIETNQLEDAKQLLDSGQYDEAIDEFEAVVSVQGEAQKYYELGCKNLVKGKYQQAIFCFKKAVTINNLFAEAYQGLAEAYKGKGDMEQCQYYLKKAADIYAEFDQMEKVKEVFIEILKYEKDPINPFNNLGVRLRREGDYQGAIRAYRQALDLTPEDENIYFNLAKALYFMEERESALKNLTIALRMNKDFDEALKLYKTIKGKQWPAAAQAQTPKAARKSKVDDDLDG
ncbi:MAG: tetratricopeptide repeat protein [Desulfovibrionaceae bacterium]|nr:tetratricopeptide repeat protein [Desulfovibrionaceae bacterium]